MKWWDSVAFSTLESVTSILPRLTVFAFGGGAMKLAILTPASFSLHTACLMRQWEGRRERGKERREGFGYAVTTVVAEEWTLRLDNKMLTSARHDIIVLNDNECNPQRAWIWLVISSFSYGNNLMVAAWPDPFSLRRVWLARLGSLPDYFLAWLKVVWSWDYYTLWSRTRVEYIRRDWRINRTEKGGTLK